MAERPLMITDVKFTARSAFRSYQTINTTMLDTQLWAEKEVVGKEGIFSLTCHSVARAPLSH